MRTSPRSNTGVYVASPKTQHSYQTALAAQESAVLRRYLTGFYFKRGGPLNATLQLLPASLRLRAERQLRRRRLEELDEHLIECVAGSELLCTVIERSATLRPLSGRLLLWERHLRRFQERVIERIRSERPRVVVCYDTCAIRIFAAAREVGALCVLDQSIGHVTRYVRELASAGIVVDLPDGFIDDSIAEVQNADLVLAGSHYVRQSVEDVGVSPERILVIPYGVDLERFRPHQSTGDGVRALYVGQVSERKGIRYLIDAFSQLPPGEVKLEICGLLLGSAEWVTARPHFSYHPALPQHEIMSAYSNADFFVQVSLHEGSSLTTYEALASGLPLITTPNSGSVVRDGIEGIVVPPRDSDALATAMLRLARSPSLRRQMAGAARRRSMLFSWQAYRHRVGKLLADLSRTVTSREATDVVTAHRAELAGALA